VELEVPVIGILRGVDPGFVGDVVDASFAAGLDAVEITMNSERPLETISRHRPSVPAGKHLGVGTIRTAAEAERAIGAGAMFLVTPNTDAEVISCARAQGVPVIAGAMTPTEVHTAWSAGADMVKIFPCRALGPPYLRELLGPFDGVPLVAVGGVGRDNVRDYFAAGATAVGVGATLFGATALASRDLGGVARSIADFIALCPRRGAAAPR